MAAKQMKKTNTQTATVDENAYSSPDYILCRSITPGGLNINCKSGNVYEFNNYGQETEIEYRDLIALIRKRSDHIFMPRIIIEDNDFLENEFPQIIKVYEDMYTTQDLEEILQLPDAQMKEVISDMSNGLKDSLRSLAATDVAKGKIDSVKKIRTLTEVFGSDFNLLSELFG